MGDFGDDQISALDGNDIVAGGAGSNSLNGGDGVDTVSFMVDPTAAAYYRSHFPGSLPTFEAGAYVDLANGTATNYSGGADYLTGFENVVGSFFGDILIGDDGDNKFHGLTGNDHIDGGAGTDTVSYAVWDNGGRIGTVIPGTLGSLPDGVTVNLSTGVAQDGEGGLDSLVSIENVLGSVGNDIIDGNAVANVLDGGAGADRLNGRAGADFMIGGDGNDTYFVDNVGDEVVETNADSLTGGVDRVISVVSYVLGANVETLTLSGLAVDGVGNDLANTITGTGTNNQISGEGGDDRLNGGAGADTLTGGDGNDTYYVDNAGDEVIETNADLVIGGTDRVLSTIGYTLGANVENLYLTGTAAIDGTGNELANIIYGNEAANALQGAGGADRLNGGAGADTLTGGDGSDTYYVDSAGDEVIETNADLATGGTDRVFSTIGYALGANVENLYLTGTAAIDGTGNELANIIYGNEAANALQGAGGC